jgi:predicted DNA-binding protein
MKKTKRPQINIRTTRRFQDRLARASKVLEKPAALIVREAVDDHLDELARRFPELRRESLTEDAKTRSRAA